jgi:hypothetical protein
MVVQLRKRLNRDDLQVRDQGCFSGVHFGHGHALISIGARGSSHGQEAARVTDDTVQRELADHEGVLHGFERQAPAQDDDAQRNGKIVGRAFLADGGRGKVDHNAVTGKVQTGVLDGSLHAFAAFLHSCVRQADNDHGR